MTTLLLVRHGETDWNREGRWQGWADPPLNDTGRAQARALAAQVEGDGFRSLWSSDLSRARETAEIVGAHIGLEVRLDERLREGGRGRWEGRLFEDVEGAEPKLYATWRRGGASWRFPGGESLVEHQQRVVASLLDIHRSCPLPALVVCHGGSIRVMLCLRDRRGLDAFHDFDIPNTALIPL
jgi:broad specificity phosphatase PhoE